MARPENDFFKTAPEHFTRSGTLSPLLVLKLLLFLVADAGRRGYQALIDSFWDECQTHDLPLPGERSVSASAFCQARKKLAPRWIRALLHSFADQFDQLHGSSFREKGYRLVGCDGAKVSLRRSKELRDAYGAPTGGACPQILLSTLYDVCSGMPLDARVARNRSSEREELIAMLDRLGPGDILLLDRGYPSYALMAELRRRGIHFVIRVRTSSTFRTVVRFLKTGRSHGPILIHPPVRARIKAPSLPLRIATQKRNGRAPLVVLSDLDEQQFTAKELTDLYLRRWAHEELYRVMKGDYIGQGQLHAKSAMGVEQEIYAFLLFLALSRLLLNEAARTQGKDASRLSQKTSILVTAAYLTRLLLITDRKRTKDMLSRIHQWMARRKYKPRPGRAYRRRSFKPNSKWHGQGRRAKDKARLA